VWVDDVLYGDVFDTYAAFIAPFLQENKE